MKILKRIFFITTGFLAGTLLFLIYVYIFPTSECVKSLYVGDEYLGRKRIPNQDIQYSVGCFFEIASRVHYNNKGFHSSFDYNENDKNDVAILGDSFIDLDCTPDDLLFDATLRKKYKDMNAEVSVLNFGLPGAGLGDIIKLVEMSKKRYGCSSVVIKTGYSDILDEYKLSHGHFVYGKKNDKLRVELVPYKVMSEKLRDFAPFRFVFFNLEINPKTIKEKLLLSLGVKFDDKKTKKAKTKIQDLDIEIFNKFVADMLSLYDSSNVLILLTAYNDECDDKIKEILNANKISFLELSEVSKNDTPRNMSHWHNDSHWNATGVERVSDMIMRTDFSRRVIEANKTKK